MTSTTTRARVLDPLERFSEIVFGLIMVLSFTGAMSVADIGRNDVRTMLIAAIGCNLAWGIIDAAFYLIACLSESGYNAKLLRGVQQATESDHAHRAIAEALPPRIAEALQPDDFERIRTHLKQLPELTTRARFTGEDWRGALGVFLLVFLSTFPVVIPFMVISDPRLALHLSNAVAIALLYGTGHMLAGYAGISRILTGLAMVAIGSVLVAITIALGG
jgi:hypothetical protein